VCHQTYLVVDVCDNGPGQPRRHLLQSGWSVFVSSKRLVAGDAFIFLRFVDFSSLFSLAVSVSFYNVEYLNLLQGREWRIKSWCKACDATTRKRAVFCYI